MESKPALKKLIVVEEAQWIVPHRRDYEPPSIGEVMVSELRKHGYGVILIVHHFEEIPYTTFFDAGTRIGLSSFSLPRSYIENWVYAVSDSRKRQKRWESLHNKMLVLRDDKLVVHRKPEPIGKPKIFQRKTQSPKPKTAKVTESKIVETKTPAEPKKTPTPRPKTAQITEAKPPQTPKLMTKTSKKCPNCGAEVEEVFEGRCEKCIVKEDARIEDIEPPEWIFEDTKTADYIAAIEISSVFDPEIVFGVLEVWFTEVRRLGYNLETRKIAGTSQLAAEFADLSLPQAEKQLADALRLIDPNATLKIAWRKKDAGGKQPPYIT